MESYHHPNFPPSLSILPSILPTSTESDLQLQDMTYGIAGKTWPASFALLGYLLTTTLTSPITILDVGSGNGFLGLSLVESLLTPTPTRTSMRKEMRLIMTDLEDVVPLLEKNLAVARARWLDSLESQEQEQEQEQVPEVLVRPLPWGSYDFFKKLVIEFPEFGSSTPLKRERKVLILCSDLVYFPQLYPPLLRTLLWLTDVDEEREVIISYKIRSFVREEPFWSALGRYFTMTPLSLPPSSPPPPTSLTNKSSPTSTINPPELSSEAHLLSLSRRRETKHIKIPIEDEHLMRGGPEEKKNVDDQFELWLLGGINVDDSDEDVEE